MYNNLKVLKFRVEQDEKSFVFRKPLIFNLIITIVADAATNNCVFNLKMSLSRHRHRSNYVTMLPGRIAN